MLLVSKGVLNVLFTTNHIKKNTTFVTRHKHWCAQHPIYHTLPWVGTEDMHPHFVVGKKRLMSSFFRLR